MCGSATLAMVVSSACMMVASMTEMATSPGWASRFRSGAAMVAAVILNLLRRGLLLRRLVVRYGIAEEAEQAAEVLGVDLDNSAHAGAQRGVGRRIDDVQADRDALHHLDPV